MKYWLAIFLSTSLWVVQVQAAQLKGRVLNILSGDHVEVIAVNQRTYTIRLRGIKSPQVRSRAGRVAKKHLAMLVAGKALVVEYNKIDYKGVLLGTIKLGGNDINSRQVRDGMAKAVPKELTADLKKRYQTAELKARQGRLGIWRLAKNGF